MFPSGSRKSSGQSGRAGLDALNPGDALWRVNRAWVGRLSELQCPLVFVDGRKGLDDAGGEQRFQLFVGEEFSPYLHQ